VDIKFYGSSDALEVIEDKCGNVDHGFGEKLIVNPKEFLASLEVFFGEINVVAHENMIQIYSNTESCGAFYIGKIVPVYEDLFYQNTRLHILFDLIELEDKIIISNLLNKITLLLIMIMMSIDKIDPYDKYLNELYRLKLPTALMEKISRMNQTLTQYENSPTMKSIQKEARVNFVSMAIRDIAKLNYDISHGDEKEALISLKMILNKE